MIKDEAWPVARLIPISSASGVEAQERRAASALLAVLSTVDEFGRALLRPLGAPSGRIEAFIEVPFKIDGKSIRPDGIIIVSRGSTTWGAIVETKTGSNQLDPTQLESYINLAKELEFNAVLSISNQYVTSSNPFPVSLKKTKRVAVHHWSWVDVLTEAVVQKQYRGIRDSDQAYILGELIRYLSDPRSGAVSFADMGPAWTAVRDGARVGTLRRGDPNVEAVAYRWDELVRYLCLDLTKDLGRDVNQIVRKEERDPAARLRALKESLAEQGRVHAEVDIPDVTGSLLVVADLRSRQVTVSTRLDAPRTGQTRGRVSWILRQLSRAPQQVNIEAGVARSATTLSASLGEARERPELLYPEKGKEVRHFEISLTRDMGVKRATGRGSFINSVISTTKLFYSEVLQNLTAWKARPPKLLPRTEEEEIVQEVVAQHEDLAEPLKRAQAEQDKVAGEAGEFATDLAPENPAPASNA